MAASIASARTAAGRPRIVEPRRPSGGSAVLVRTLEQVCLRFGGRLEADKLALLESLAGRVLGSASQVRRLHEALCLLRAYPDGPRLLARVEAMLAGFSRRRDLRRHRRALAGTGIAGTRIEFRFFWPTARWLARRWGRQLRVAWVDFDQRERLADLLPLLVLYGETPALDEIDYSPRQWLARLKGPEETDAAFLVRRFAELPMDEFAREKIYDQLDPPLRIAPGSDTPSRTRAWHPAGPVVFRSRPLNRRRPELSVELRRPPRATRALSAREGQRLIDLARESMVTRSRDLDAFSWGSPDDVRLTDCGGGLQFAVIGVIPERRLLLEAVYGVLTLMNGVPIGYVLNSALYGSAEIAYNVFETWRGGESSAVYARALAVVRHLFGCDSFTIYPYQLGDGNHEAIATGAWWFYHKLGFRPRDRDAVRSMREEEQRMRRRPSHRSSVATLRRLARANLFYHLGRRRDDVIGALPLPAVGLAVTRGVASRFGSDRERAARVCGEEAMRALGVRSQRGWSAGEKLAWERWSPLILMLRGLSGWKPDERRALVEVVRSKGGRRESEFVWRFDRHRTLRDAVRRLALREDRDNP